MLAFPPFLALRRALDLQTIAGATFASSLLCFNLWTSSVYLTYDMLDQAADRLHHRKRHRPFAPGTSLGQGRCTVAAIKEDGEAPVSEIAGFGLIEI